MNDVALYFKLIRMSVQSQMQYRASFIMMSFGLGIVVFVEFLAIWILFDRFGHLGGWSLPEVGLFYGVIHASFALAEGVGRGFDIFHRQVLRGDFDRLLLRPRSTVLQVLGSDLQLMRIGRLVQGLAVLVWSAGALGIEWTLFRVIVLVLSVGGGVMLFIGLMVFQATLSFWSVQGLEFMNSFTNGGVVVAQYPLSIYRGWLRNFFLYIIPLGCVNYFPVLLVLGREDVWGSPAWFQALSPLAGVVFLLVALRFWHYGVGRYESTGS